MANASSACWPRNRYTNPASPSARHRRSQEYSYQNDGVDLGGSVDCYTTFAGGALSVQQTVSMIVVITLYRLLLNEFKNNPFN